MLQKSIEISGSSGSLSPVALAETLIKLPFYQSKTGNLSYQCLDLV